MVTCLPNLVAFLSNKNQKYLSYVKEGDAQRHLQFSGNEVISRSTKFAMERSSKHKELVHIRCCHNNKYLVKKSEAERWIVAAAEKQEEDPSLSTCTLFRPLPHENDADGRTVLKLWHVQTASCVCTSGSSKGVFGNSLCVESGSRDEDDSFDDGMTVIDWETLVVLPKHVAFKGGDGKYLRVEPGSKFSCCEDKTDPEVGNDIETNSDGSVCIKKCDGDGFWASMETGLIDITSPAGKSSSKEISKSFMPIKIGKNTVALRCLPFNSFCLRRVSSEADSNGSLLCNGNSIVREARFDVEELVISRQVYNVKYHIEDARIFDEVSITKATAGVVNDTRETLTKMFAFRYQDQKSSTWRNGVSFSVKISLSAGIPFIMGKDGIGILGEYNGDYEWGETKTEITELEKSYTYVVPPMTRFEATVLATRGTCEVPFSYIVRDVHTDGKVVVYEMDDGVYTGINSYDLRSETETKPLVN